jgi:Holliday junction resolvasome RuvABC endonuclease subunit
MRLFCGIDPGSSSGAWGIVDHNGNYWSSDFIHSEGKRIVVTKFSDDLRMAIGREDVSFVVEDVHSMPKQGIASTFTFARAVGAIEATTRLFRSPWFIVSPQRWKADMGVTADKETSLELARKLWPDAPLSRVKDNNVAEALLLAEWLRRQEL